MATRISLDEAQSLPDILSSENFRLNIGNIPGIGDGGALSIKCQNVEYPGRNNQSYEVPLGGFWRTFRGRNRFGQNTMAASFVDDITRDTHVKLGGWLEQIDGTNSGTAMGAIADYSVTAELSIFDQAGNEIEVITFYNFYVTDVQAIQLETQASQPIQYGATFRFDYFISNLISAR